LYSREPNANPPDQLPDQLSADTEETADTEECHFLLFPNVFAITEIFEDRKPAKRFRVEAALYQLSYAPIWICIRRQRSLRVKVALYP